MARFGDNIRPELGATDFSPFLQGSMQGSAMLGQGLQNLGAGVGQFLGDRGKMKSTMKAGLNSINAFQQFYEQGSPEHKALEDLKIKMEDAPLSEAAAIAGEIPKFLEFAQNAAQQKLMRDQFAADTAYRDREQFFKSYELGQTDRLLDAQIQGLGGGSLTLKKGPFGVTYAVPSGDGPPSFSSGDGTATSSWGSSEGEGAGQFLGSPASPSKKKLSGGAAQTLYPSDAAKALDEQLLKAHGEKYEQVPGWDRRIRQLNQLADALEDSPDAEARFALKKLGQIAMTKLYISKGELDALGEDPATKMMITIARENALEKAAERNERMTDQDVVQELRITMHPGLGKEEALRIATEKLHDLKLKKTLFTAEREYMQENNGSLLGFDPTGSGIELRDLTPEEIHSLPMSEWKFSNPDGGWLSREGLEERINKQRAKEGLPPRQKPNVLDFEKLEMFNPPGGTSGEGRKSLVPPGKPLKKGPPGAREDVPDKSGASNITDFVKEFEGWNPKPYNDYKQKSIGYGTKAKRGEKSITKEEAEKRLEGELSLHRARVMAHAKKHGYNWTPAQIDALTSFDYNTGRLSQLTANGKRTNAQIAEKMPLYRKAGGKVLRGLVKRRNAERELFLNGYPEMAEAPEPEPEPQAPPVDEEAVAMRSRAQLMEELLKSRGFPVALTQQPREEPAQASLPRVRMFSDRGALRPVEMDPTEARNALEARRAALQAILRWMT